jgi:hypothetical protein
MRIPATSARAAARRLPERQRTPLRSSGRMLKTMPLIRVMASIE